MKNETISLEPESAPERLRAAIRRAGLHHYEVANRVGIHSTRLSQILTGRIVPKQPERDALAKAVDVAASDIWRDAP